MQRFINLIIDKFFFIGKKIKKSVSKMHREIKQLMRKTIKKCKKLWSAFIRHLDTLLLLALTAYILYHWEKCISMQFFIHFDGNNILFLVWLALLILTFYDVESDIFKMHKKSIEEKIEITEESFSRKFNGDRINHTETNNIETLEINSNEFQEETSCN